MKPCTCEARHERKRIVLTGGPGAGKTAVLELVRQQFCAHVHVLPEAAGVVFGGGFPRTGSPDRQRSAQRAIYFVQRELERTSDADDVAIVLCDRGTVDGAAYWPGPDDFWDAVGTTREQELRRYHAVIHLRTPSIDRGYNHVNPLRTETASMAAAIDERLLQIWDGHPRRYIVPAAADFLRKATQTIEILHGELPECCAMASRRATESQPGQQMPSTAGLPSGYSRPT
jgi:predicted ATPase